ncbi:hypothetical protein Tco_0173866 [Tanacetum coccineum]
MACGNLTIQKSVIYAGPKVHKHHKKAHTSQQDGGEARETVTVDDDHKKAQKSTQFDRGTMGVLHRSLLPDPCSNNSESRHLVMGTLWGHSEVSDVALILIVEGLIDGRKRCGGRRDGAHSTLLYITALLRGGAAIKAQHVSVYYSLDPFTETRLSLSSGPG